jgi:hypothetical protein
MAIPVIRYRVAEVADAGAEGRITMGVLSSIVVRRC